MGRRGTALVVALGLLGFGALVGPASATPAVVQVLDANAPTGVAPLPDGRAVYVADSNASVSVLDPATHAITAVIAVGGNPQGLAASPDSSTVYVATGTGTITAVDTATNTVSGTFSAGLNGVQRLAVSPDGGVLYAAGNELAMIDTATDAVIRTVQAGSGLEGMSLNADGSKLWVANSSNAGSAVEVDTATGAILATVATGSYPYDASITPDGSEVWVANYYGASASVISTRTDTVIATIPLGGYPNAVAVSPDGSRAYVVSGGPNDTSMEIIDVATNEVQSALDLGAYGVSIAVAPDGTRVYVAEEYHAPTPEVAIISDVAAAPDAPVHVTALPGRTSATVSWTAPAPNGSPVTGYTVTAEPGAATCTTAGTTSCVVTGLHPGTRYSFTVTATNGVGAGPASAPATLTLAVATPPGPAPATPLRLVGQTLWGHVEIGARGVAFHFHIVLSAPRTGVRVQLEAVGGHRVLARSVLSGRVARTVFTGEIRFPASAVHQWHRYTWTVTALADGSTPAATFTRAADLRRHSLLAYHLTRIGNVVTVHGAATVLDPATGHYVAFGGEPFVVQQRTARGWVTVASRTTGRTGLVSVRLTSRSRVTLRLLSSDTATAFGRTTVAKSA